MRSAPVLAILAVGGFGAARSLAKVDYDARQFAAIVNAMGPPSPRLLAFTSDISVGHPLTRLVAGTWVGAGPSQWIYHNALRRLGREGESAPSAQSLRALMRKDRDLLASALRQGRADILLFDRRVMDWLAWAQRDGEIAELLSAYAPAANVEEIDIWRRVTQNAAPDSGVVTAERRK